MTIELVTEMGLPDLYQVTIGGGVPVTSHGRETVAPIVMLKVSSTASSITGATEVEHLRKIKVDRIQY